MTLTKEEKLHVQTTHTPDDECPFKGSNGHETDDKKGIRSLYVGHIRYRLTGPVYSSVLNVFKTFIATFKNVFYRS